MYKLVIASTLLITLLIPTTNVLARDGENSGSSEEIEQNRQEIRDRLEERSKELQERAASRSAEIKQKLTAVKLKVCQTRQEIIKTRSQNLANRANRQFTVFGNIAERVETFYTSKVLPKGITVANYDQLVSDIATQKTGAQTAIAAATAAANAFDCSGDNPKAQLEDFNAKMKIARDALKDYRTAIKNLIVSVKTALEDHEETATNSAQ